MSDFKKVSVQLDQPIFISGGNLGGKVLLKTNLLRNIQRVKLSLRGRASVSFICSNGRSVSEDRLLTNTQIKTWNGNEIQAELPFQYKIPTDLPASFIGTAGKVKYWLLVELKGSAFMPGSNFRFGLVLANPKSEFLELQRCEKMKRFGASGYCNAVLETKFLAEQLVAELNVENKSRLTFYDIKVAIRRTYHLF